MFIRNGIAVLAVWALFLAPFLCGVGVLTHSCICDDSTECRHELQCSTDPCRILALGWANQNSKATGSTTSVDQLQPPVLVTDVLILPETRPEPVPGPGDDLPLVIVPDLRLPLLC